MKAISRFTMSDHIFMTTDGYHYESVLERVSSNLGIRTRRQRCLFHIEKDLAHRIKDAGRENDLDMAKRLIKYMFFQNRTNMDRLGKNRDAVMKLTGGKSE